jgi:hypothetical protein
MKKTYQVVCLSCDYKSGMVYGFKRAKELQKWHLENYNHSIMIAEPILN